MVNSVGARVTSVAPVRRPDLVILSSVKDEGSEAGAALYLDRVMRGVPMPAGYTWRDVPGQVNNTCWWLRNPDETRRDTLMGMRGVYDVCARTIRRDGETRTLLGGCLLS